MPRLRFLILGPVALERPDGTPVDIGGRNARAILLSLLLDVGRAVPVDRITFDVWGDDPPPSADQVIRSTISRLRHVLGPDRLEAIDHSYVLLLDPNRIDAVQFERSVDEAARLLAAGRPEPAAAACRSALQLWRGPPFGDLESAPFAELEARRLDELHARAVELHLEAEVALGDTGGVIGRLQAEAESHRYRERLWALLITALSREGRRAEAIRAFDDAAALLAEIGLEPCSELKELVARVVREDTEVEAHLA